MKKILIALDDGPSSGKVAAAGLEIGQQLSAEIALVSVVDTSILITEGGVTPEEFTEFLKTDFNKNQQILSDEIFKDYRIRRFVEVGKPFEEILRVEKEWEADLIILGTHGRTGLSHLLMDSVAEKVIRHSSKPVLIIPAR